MQLHLRNLTDALIVHMARTHGQTIAAFDLSIAVKTVSNTLRKFGLNGNRRLAKPKKPLGQILFESTTPFADRWEMLRTEAQDEYQQRAEKFLKAIIHSEQLKPVDR